MVLIKDLFKMVLRPTILHESECKAHHTLDKCCTNTIEYKVIHVDKIRIIIAYRELNERDRR